MPYKIYMAKSNIILNWNLYLSAMCLGVDPRMDTKKTCVYEKLNYMLKICEPF